MLIQELLMANSGFGYLQTYPVPSIIIRTIEFEAEVVINPKNNNAFAIFYCYLSFNLI